MSIMDRVKKNLREWYTLAADRTGEMAKISVRMYDKYGISREIERQLSELGSHVYHAVEQGRTEFADDQELAAFIERIQGLEQDLEAKVEEIEEIRLTRAQRQAERDAMADAAADATGGAATATAVDLPAGAEVSTEAAEAGAPDGEAPARRDLGPAEELDRPHDFGPGPELAADADREAGRAGETAEQEAAAEEAVEAETGEADADRKDRKDDDERPRDATDPERREG